MNYFNKYLVLLLSDSWGRYLVSPPYGCLVSKGSYKHNKHRRKAGKSPYLFGHPTTVYGTVLAPAATSSTDSGTPGLAFKVSASSGEVRLSQSLACTRTVFPLPGVVQIFYCGDCCQLSLRSIVTVPTAVHINIEDLQKGIYSKWSLIFLRI